MEGVKVEKEQLIKGLGRKKEDLIREYDRLDNVLKEDVKDRDYSHMAKISSELKSVYDRINLLNEIMQDICFES